MRSLIALVLIAALAAPAWADDAAPSGAAAPVQQNVAPPPKVYGWAFGGAAAGCLVLGAVLGGVALADSNAQNGNAANPPVYTHSLQKQGSQGAALATSAYVFFGVGAALAVIDGVIWFETLRHRHGALEKVAAALSPEGVRF